MLPFPQPGTDLQIILLLALQRLGMGWKITGSPENLPNLCKDLEGKLTICCMLEQLRIRTLVAIHDLNSAGSRNVFINTDFVFRESHTTVNILNLHSVLCTVRHFLINMIHKLVKDLEIRFVFYSFGSLQDLNYREANLPFPPNTPTKRRTLTTSFLLSSQFNITGISGLLCFNGRLEYRWSSSTRATANTT